MKGQTAAFLEKSRELLGEAETIYSVNLHETAARTAYLAGLHAAQGPYLRNQQPHLQEPPRRQRRICPLGEKRPAR